VNHEAAQYAIDVVDADGEEHLMTFDPEEIFPGIRDRVGPLKRPLWYPIISSLVLAKALLKRSSGEINGFVIETAIAGGHNAPPRGPMQLNDRGEPIYGPKDEIDVAKIAELGIPFWLAGGYGSREGYQLARELGAVGVQVGSAFAYTEESGFRTDIKQRVIDDVLAGTVQFRTDARFSPTGFPFKLVELEDTMSDAKVIAERERICDVGYLRHAYKTEEGEIGYRCPAEPIKDWLRKGGKPEETEGRGCLCNGLGSAAGYNRQRSRTNPYMERPAVTSGDRVTEIGMFIAPGRRSYAARDVIAILLGEKPAYAHSPEPEAAVAGD
jgi:nitronate monooxygenase